MYNIILEKQVEKFLLKHKGEAVILTFYKILNKLKNNPLDNTLDIKPLLGLNNSYRIRTGKYRILYEVINKDISITVFKIDSRGSVYK